MRFSVAPQIFELFPKYYVGGVVASGVNNRPDPAIAENARQELQAVVTELGQRFPGNAELTADPFISIWRDAFKTLGIKASEFLSSVEALSRRAIKTGSVPSINPAVDLSNALSLKYLLPLGGHDLDLIQGDLEVRMAREGDVFSPPDGSDTTETVPPGEPVYADDAEVRTRRWVWREGRKARITENTTNIFFPVDGWVGLNDGQVRTACEEIARLFEEKLGATCHVFYIDEAHTSAEWESAAPSDKPKIEMPAVLPPVKRERDEIDRLLTRGVAGIITAEELEARLRSGRRLRVKLGIDPTGPRIHIGRSVALQKLRDFQRLGHQIIMLFGTFTGQIGDASDKQATRPMLTPAQVESNVQDYKQQVSLILDPNEVEWRYNTEWFNQMSFQKGIELMTNFTVAQMIERDNFNDRFKAGKPISLQEIVYPVLQGYDSVMLHSDVELGGTDQMFNMMAGRQLQKVFGQEPQSILMNKMINAPDGNKMSTSLGNGVYITEPAKDQYAKMLRTLDAQIFEYFETLTRVPEPEIEEMRAAMDGGENPLHFKKRLASALVAQYHGEDAAREAADSFEREIVNKEIPTDIPEFNPAGGLAEMDLRDLLVETKLAASKKEAARFVEQGGITIDGEKPADPKAKVSLHDGMIIKRGNRHYARIKLS
ncbi:MAG: tyrosine--tRNA ligase [Chloroflexi bacterium]|nr:tyrosine--tRNA ligase [Chloroflexota bacterium]